MLQPKTGVRCLPPAVLHIYKQCCTIHLEEPIDHRSFGRSQQLPDIGQAPQALALCQEAAEIYRMRGDQLALLDVLCNIAYIYAKRLEVNNAHQSLVAALQLVNVETPVSIKLKAMTVFAALAMLDGHTEFSAQ